MNKFSFFELFAILLVLFLSAYILRPLIYDILWAFILGYIFYPFYNKLKSKIKYKRLSALITVVTGISIFAITLVFIAYALVPEVTKFMIDTYGSISKFQGLSTIDLHSFYSKIMDYIISWLPSLPRVILDFFIIFILTYYFLIDEEEIRKIIFDIIPLKEEHKIEIINRITTITKGVIYGHLLGAFVQAVTSFVGFYVLGYKYPLLYSIIVFILSILPIIGPWALWIPLAIIKIVEGQIVIGIFSIVYSLFVVGIIDDLLRPKVASEAAKVHPLITFLGMFGGILSIGPIGIFVGPIILAVTIDIIKRFELI